MLLEPLAESEVGALADELLAGIDLDDATRARIRAAEALPADTIALLERLRAA